MATTRTRAKRAIKAKSYGDDIEIESPVKQSRATGRKKEESVTTKTSGAKTSSKQTTKQSTTKTQRNSISPATSKISKKTKKDNHAFSSYFENSRSTVQFNYHISPVSQISVGSPNTGKSTGKTKGRRKRKNETTDIFDYHSEEEEEVIVLPSKRPKLSAKSDQDKPKPLSNKGDSSKKTTKETDGNTTKQVRLAVKKLPTNLSATKRAGSGNVTAEDSTTNTAKSTAGKGTATRIKSTTKKTTPTSKGRKKAEEKEVN